MSHFKIDIQKRIIQQAQAGSRDACRVLYDFFSTPVYNLSYRILNNRDDAMDLLQDVMEMVFRKLSTYTGDGELGFWIRKIAINKCFNHIRKYQLHFETIEEEKLVEDNINPHEVLHDIEYYLMQLPLMSRSIVWLYEVEGMTHKEIAQQYQMSESFSKTHLFRARKILSNIINESEVVHERKRN